MRLRTQALGRSATLAELGRRQLPDCVGVAVLRAAMAHVRFIASGSHVSSPSAAGAYALLTLTGMIWAGNAVAGKWAVGQDRQLANDSYERLLQASVLGRGQTPDLRRWPSDPRAGEQHERGLATCARACSVCRIKAPGRCRIVCSTKLAVAIRRSSA